MLLYSHGTIYNPDFLPKANTALLVCLIKKKEKLTYSVHLPLWGIEPAAFSGRIREGSIQAFVDCIELTRPLDPLCYVIHPTGAPTVEFITMGLPELAILLVLPRAGK